jgi:hypothetical protein
VPVDVQRETEDLLNRSTLIGSENRDGIDDDRLPSLAELKEVHDTRFWVYHTLFPQAYDRIESGLMRSKSVRTRLS